MTRFSVPQFAALVALLAALAAAGAAAAPGTTGRPSAAGTLRVGSTLTADRGTWAGSGTLAYAYTWYRCDALGARCKAIRGAGGQTYTLVDDDAGRTIALSVTATDATGKAAAHATPLGPVAAQGATVYATAAPKVSGTAEVGQQLKVDDGSWGVTPQSTAAQWLRCNANGRACSAIEGATAATYTPVAADVGHALVARVTAKVATTTQAVLSVSTPAVKEKGAGLPAGATPLPGGRYSVPVEAVSLPTRLLVAGARFAPARISPTAPFTATIAVTDTRGYAIRGALVLVEAPYGAVAKAKEQATGQDGTATFTLTPTAKLPTLGRALVLFVRARKPGDDVLAGVSARRLVSVRLSGA